MYNKNMETYDQLHFYDNLFCHGVTCAQKGAYISEHVHTNYEIMLFVSGNCEYVVENQRFSLKPYTLIVTQPLKYHFLYFLNDESCFERYYVQFDGGEFGEKLQRLLSTTNAVKILDKNDRICAIFKSIKEYSKTFPSDDYPELYKGLLCELVHLSCVEDKNKDTLAITEADDVTANALRYIERHLTEPLSIEIIADALFVSTSLLCHKFSAHMHTGVMNYVKTKRAHFANKLLKKGVKPTEVAERCGYNEYSSFYRVYKEIFGIGPKEANRKSIN